MNKKEYAEPGSWIGILGANEIAKMLCLSAHALGYKTIVWGTKRDECAYGTATDFANTPVEAGTINHVMKRASVITSSNGFPEEFLSSLKKTIYPKMNVVHIAQDQFAKKAFLRKLRINYPHYVEVIAEEDFNKNHAVYDFDFDESAPAILKPKVFDPSFKGITVTGRETAYATWEMVKKVPCILERTVEEICRFSIAVSMGIQGGSVSYHPVETRFKNGKLVETIFTGPNISEVISDKAQEIARRIANALELVGTLSIQFILTTSGLITVDEIYAHPTSSDMWTIDACQTNVFEQHIRAIAGLPIQNPKVHAFAKTRILRDSFSMNELFSQHSNTKFHWYDKIPTKEKKNENLGHVTHITPIRYF